MEIVLLLNGKTEEEYLQKGIDIFEKRILKYVKYRQIVLPSLKNTKNMPPEQQKVRETEAMKRFLDKQDAVILLDEGGKEYTSMEFSSFLQAQMNRGTKRLVFVVGGAYGFSEEMYALADAELSLSKMTFTHQMIRLFFVEQLYRGLSILHHDPYHNE